MFIFNPLYKNNEDIDKYEILSKQIYNNITHLSELIKSYEYPKLLLQYKDIENDNTIDIGVFEIVKFSIKLKIKNKYIEPYFILKNIHIYIETLKYENNNEIYDIIKKKNIKFNTTTIIKIKKDIFNNYIGCIKTFNYDKCYFQLVNFTKDGHLINNIDFNTLFNIYHQKYVIKNI